MGREGLVGRGFLLERLDILGGWWEGSGACGDGEGEDGRQRRLWARLLSGGSAHVGEAKVGVGCGLEDTRRLERTREG